MRNTHGTIKERMFIQAQLVLTFLVLTSMVFLGDEKQPIALVVSSGGVLSLYLYDWYANKTKFFVDKHVLAAWSALAIVFVAASIGSISVGYSITEGVKYILAFLLFIYFSNKTSHAFIEKFSGAIYIWAIAISCISFLFAWFPILQTFVPPMNLLYKAYGHNHIVDVLFFALPYSLHLLWKKKNLSSLVGLSIICVTFLTSSSRGGILLCTLYLVYFLFLQIARVRIAVAILIAAMALLALGAIFWKNPSAVSISNKPALLESRVQYWEQAAIAIKERPLLGWGPGTFYLLSKRFQEKHNSYSWYAHSFPLEILSEMGVFGAIVIMYIVGSILLCTNCGPLFHGVMLSLLYSIVEMNLNFTVIWVLLWVCIGLLKQQKIKNLAINPLLPIALLSLFYCSSVLGKIFQALPEGSTPSLYIQPYDVDQAFNFLSGKNTERAVSRADEKTLLLFHGQNPDVLFDIASSLEKTQKTSNIFNQLALIDQKNPESQRGLLKYLLAQKQYKKFFTTLNNYTNEPLHSKSIVLVPYVEGVINENNIKEIQWVLNSEWNELIFAKIYYLMGLGIVDTSPHSTEEYWNITQRLAPEWNYFYIEKASLNLYGYSNASKASKEIDTCLINLHNDAYCAIYQKDVSRLPKIGALKEQILHEVK